VAYINKLWASLKNKKPRRSERDNGLTSRCDKKSLLLNFKSGDQNPLKKTGYILKNLFSGIKIDKILTNEKIDT
jgi:hypothetical protein